MIITTRVDKLMVIRIKDSVILNDDTLYDEVSNALKNADTRHIRIDLADMELIDDHGVDMLCRLVGKYTQRGYIIKLQNPRVYLLKLLVVKGLIDKIAIDFDEHKS